MSAACINQPELGVVLAQCSTKAYLALLLAPKMLVAHRYQHISRLGAQQKAQKVGRRGPSDAIVESGVGDASRQRYVGEDGDDGNAVMLEFANHLGNLRNVAGLQKNTMAASSGDRSKSIHDFGRRHRLPQLEARTN